MRGGGNFRPERVAEAIKEETARLLAGEVHDPRLADSLPSVLHVKVTKDLEHAVISVSFLDPAGADKGMAALASATGFIRSRLAAVLGLRRMPSLAFKYDNTLVEQERLARLIEEANRPRPAAADEGAATEPAPPAAGPSAGERP